MDVPVKPIPAWQLNDGEPGHSPSEYGWHLLAEGDSWFAYGTLFGDNLIDHLSLGHSTLVTKTATPGDTLGHMADWWRDANFPALIGGGAHGNRAWAFDAILLSGGGNDLIDAISDRAPGQRLLRLLDPQATPPGRAADCVNEAAWQRFEAYLRANFRQIADFVAGSARNAHTPLFVHTYDFPTARDAPAWPSGGPWLAPALRAHHVPEGLWAELVDLLFTRLGDVVRSLNLPNVHVVDTAGVLTRALPGTHGSSNDWVNEIHPSANGYRKLGRRWRQAIEQVLGP